MAQEKKTYSEKLKDPRWQKKRLEVFNRDNWTCRVCDSIEKTLHVHHIKYEYGKEPWEYELHMLMTMCDSCHQNEEKAKEDFKAIIEFLKQGGYTHLDLCNLLGGLLITKQGTVPKLAAKDIYRYAKDKYGE